MFLKTVLGIFKIALLFRDRLFLCGSGNFDSFQYFNFETDFLENENFFTKLKHCFLVERCKVENALFRYKTALPEANGEINRTWSTKWSYHKERCFASKDLGVFWEKKKISVEEPLIKSCFDATTTQISIFILFVYRGILFNGDFFLWVSVIK